MTSVAAHTTSGTGPLSGMHVLDLSQQLPGPYCTLLLASLGATVTKVEPPAGDTARAVDPDMFQRVNRGKRSLRLDLKDPSAQEELRGLVQKADVFLEGFRPGVTARLGCDFERLSAINPALVYCSISGFGQTGPLASQPTHDLSLQAIAGALSPSAQIDTVGVPWVDLGVATTAALLIVSHWRAAQAVHLDLAMLDVASAWAGIKPTAVFRHEPTYGTFHSSDSVPFVLALLEDDMWSRLCQAIGLEQWAAEQSLQSYHARVDRAAVVRDRVGAELARRTAAELTALAEQHDLPLDRVGDLGSSEEHEHIVWRRQASPQQGLVPFGGAGVELAGLSEES
jgi:CoA:oxalate CoA-transferase